VLSKRCTDRSDRSLLHSVSGALFAGDAAFCESQAESVTFSLTLCIRRVRLAPVRRDKLWKSNVSHLVDGVLVDGSSIDERELGFAHTPPGAKHPNKSATKIHQKP
jgi:hypothetical protein